jgi:hypothetical protein
MKGVSRKKAILELIDQTSTNNRPPFKGIQVVLKFLFFLFYIGGRNCGIS